MPRNQFVTNGKTWLKVEKSDHNNYDDEEHWKRPDVFNKYKTKIVNARIIITKRCDSSHDIKIQNVTL